MCQRGYSMAVLQSLSCQSILETMEELARVVFFIIIKHRCNNLRVDLICDRYPDISIKNAERNRRASVGGICTRILSGNQTYPKQWKSIYH